MAGLTNADPSHRLSVDAPPPPIPKDLQGSDCSVPLSPQWLLPKMVDSKLSLVAKEPHPHPGKHTDPVKALGNVEDLSVTEKRKDVYRPSFFDSEKGRRGHWGDEEREANSVIRRDSQREGEELGDSRKLDRWTNTGSRYSQEARRFPSERGNDSGNRESAYEQRRESKWNTRWGPDDKDSEKRREKWSGKDLESSHDKGAHHITIHAKDISNQGKDTEKEGEQYRLWRSSLVVNRVKGETSPYLSSTTHKTGAPMFGHGRGKGDNDASALSVGRGRVSLSASNASGGPTRQFPLGTVSDRSSGGYRDPHNLRYSRMKLLDICRTTDLKGYRMSFEWFQEFPSLMQADPLMPLSLTAPTAEELFILEAIDKGDILSSGVPMASKDGSSGKNSVDSGLLIPTKSGIGEDAAPVMNDQKDERTGHWIKDHSGYVDKCSLGFDSKVPPGELLCQSQEILTAEAFKFETPPNKAYDSSKEQVSKVEDAIRGRSQSVGDRSKSSDSDGFNKQKEMAIEQKNKRADSSSSYLLGDPHWQDSVNIKSDLRTESQIIRQLSETMQQEGEVFSHTHGQGDPFILRDKLTDRKPPSQQYLSPEHLSLFYKDPQGQIQGPFSGSNLIEWFDAGYFGANLAVRLANAPVDAPFSSLGDVIPQLRTRVRPPPGFGSARQNDIAEASNRVKFGGPAAIHGGLSDLELMKNGQVLRNESKVKAENQFLESLMSGRISSLPDNYSLPEGMQGYNGLAGGRPLGIENTNDMKYSPQNPLEQRSPLLSPYRVGRESPAMLPKPDAMGEFPIPPKILPQIGEVPHHIPQSLQHIDLLSILQSAADKTPPPPPIKPASPLWPNFSEVQSLKSAHGAMDISKDAFEPLPNQQNSQSGFGALPKRLQPQFPPPLSNQTPAGGLPMPPEKLVASEFNQDVQMANILRQQYMLAQQFHSQVPLPTNLNQMEFLLLLQRHQQEQQQNQLLLKQQQQQQQHQQHFLSQPLSGYHSYKHNNEPSFSPLSAEVVHENASSKGSVTRMHELPAQISRQMHVLDSNDGNASGLSGVSLRGAREASVDGNVEHSPLNLLNQFINLAPHSTVMDDSSSLDVEPTDTSVPSVVSSVEDNAPEAFNLLSDSIDTGVSQDPHQLLQSIEILTDTCDPVRNLALSDRDEGILNSKPSVLEISSAGTISEQVSSGARGAAEPKGVEDAEQCEVKKISEKKSRKHKNSRVKAAAESRKGSEKAPADQKSKTNSEIGVVEKGAPMEAAEPPFTTLKAEGENHASSLMESLDCHGGLLSSGALDKRIKADETKVKEGEFVPPFSNSKAWKPVPGAKKTKPLSEIQMEEQLRAQTSDHVPEIIPAIVSAAALAGEHAVDAAQRNSLRQSISVNSENRQIPLNVGKISQLPVVLDDDVLPKASGGKDNNICSEEKGASSLSLPQMGAEVEAAIDNDDFIEAKETRKSRKKAAKSKGVAAKVSLPNNPAVPSVSASGAEQTKATCPMLEDKDVPPCPPAAPSLGDFVFWKGDQASPVPSPAWSTDSVKVQKPTFLRDIFKEQDRKVTRKSGQQQTPMPTPTPTTKVQPGKGNGGGSSSPLVPASSTSKASAPKNSNSAAPTQTSSLSSGQHKTGMDDDFFWGPLKQSKEGSRSDFPSLANNPSSQNAKGIPVKGGAQSEGSSKKASKPVEHSVTSSPAITRSLSKGKKDTESKFSEAMDFRNWCEGEWLRLTGTNDISFLEFCLKQPTEEAAVLLRENLLSLDHNHQFIDKFINYMEFLSSEIIEIAFQSRKSSKMSGENEPRASHGARIPRNVDAEVDDGGEASSKGKKKGKKGKKLSPSLLGFNVVSNRIMMGDIQTIEE